MGKYTTYNRTPPRPRARGVHPLMRGIGCILMIVVPVLSYGLALFLVDYGIRRGWPLPPDWLEPVSIHPLLLQLRGLDPLWNILLQQDNFIAVALFTIAIMIVIGGVMSVIYGYLYSIFGPPQYGPQDAPPIRIKVKRYKR